MHGMEQAICVENEIHGSADFLLALPLVLMLVLLWAVPDMKLPGAAVISAMIAAAISLLVHALRFARDRRFTAKNWASIGSVLRALPAQVKRIRLLLGLAFAALNLAAAAAMLLHITMEGAPAFISQEGADEIVVGNTRYVKAESVVFWSVGLDGESREARAHAYYTEESLAMVMAQRRLRDSAVMAMSLAWCVLGFIYYHVHAAVAAAKCQGVGVAAERPSALAGPGLSGQPSMP